jgi:hypothetical protein
VDPAEKPGKWLTEEDAKLTEAVQRLGKDCWVAVAAMVPSYKIYSVIEGGLQVGLVPDRASNTVE